VGKLPIFLQGSKVEGLPWAKLFSPPVGLAWSKKLFIKTHFTQRATIFTIVY
jgi:hypothetical protein